VLLFLIFILFLSSVTFKVFINSALNLIAVRFGANVFYILRGNCYDCLNVEEEPFMSLIY